MTRHEEMVGLLLKAGADMEAEDEDGLTVASIANLWIEEHDSYYMANIVRAFL